MSSILWFNLTIETCNGKFDRIVTRKVCLFLHFFTVIIIILKTHARESCWQSDVYNIIFW